MPKLFGRADNFIESSASGKRSATPANQAPLREECFFETVTSGRASILKGTVSTVAQYPTYPTNLPRNRDKASGQSLAPSERGLFVGVMRKPVIRKGNESNEVDVHRFVDCMFHRS